MRAIVIEDERGYVDISLEPLDLIPKLASLFPRAEYELRQIP